MTPAWPSPAFDRWALRRLESEVPVTGAPMLSAAFLAVTSRCPLHCVHCSAADELGRHDRLDLATLQQFVRELQAARVSQIVLTGGEPMVRLGDVLTLVREADPGTELWMNTSGLGLDATAARQLAEAGLVGVWVSLDSEQPDENDAFRGWPGAFDMARQAVHNAAAAGLAAGLSLVATRALVDRGGLDAYGELAAQWDVGLVRVLTPKAVGRWAGQDVALDDAQVARLAAWTDALNGGPRYRERPFVLCDEVVNRRMGCKQAGELSVYVDSRGQVHGCPFCLRSGGSLLDGTLAEALQVLRSGGCPAFAAAAK